MKIMTGFKTKQQTIGSNLDTANVQHDTPHTLTTTTSPKPLFTPPTPHPFSEDAHSRLRVYTHQRKETSEENAD